MRRRKNQVGVKSMVAEEIIVQCMSTDVSRKQQKYTGIGAQDYMPFKHTSQIEKELVCHVLAGECRPSCSKVCQVKSILTRL